MLQLRLFMGGESLLCQLLILGAWLAIVGIRPDADATTRSEDTCHLDVFRIHQLDEVLHDDVDTVLMEVAMVAETEEVKLQALALHHLHIWYVTDANLRKVRLSRNRTKRRELRAVESYPVVVAWMLVAKSLQHLWRIIHFIFGLGSESLQTILFSIHCLGNLINVVCLVSMPKDILI